MGRKTFVHVGQRGAGRLSVDARSWEKHRLSSVRAVFSDPRALSPVVAAVFIFSSRPRDESIASLRRVGRRLAGHAPATAARFTARIAGASVERLSGFGRSGAGWVSRRGWFQNGGNAATSRVLSRHLSDARAVEWRARRETATRAQRARVVMSAARARASFDAVRTTYLSEAKTATGATTPPLRIGFCRVFFAPPTGARKETVSASGIVFVLCVTRASEAKRWGRRCGVDARAGVRRASGVERSRKARAGAFRSKRIFCQKIYQFEPLTD